MEQGIEEEKKESVASSMINGASLDSPIHIKLEVPLTPVAPFAVPSEAMSFAEASILGVTIYKAMSKICSPLFPRQMNSMTRSNAHSKRLSIHITEDHHIDHHFFVTDAGFTFPFHLIISLAATGSSNAATNRLELQIHGMLKCLEVDEKVVEAKVVFDPCDFIRQCMDKGLSSLSFEEIIAGTMNSTTASSMNMNPVMMTASS
jgi:hypothetical protein